MLTGSTVKVSRLWRRAPIALVGVLAAAVAASPATAKSHHHRRHRVHATRACANANAAVGAVSRQATKAAVVCLINKQRTDRGLPALHESGLLDRSAQGWTNTMVATGAFTHGANFAGRISAVGFQWSSAGENIATGFLTPRAVVAGWMASTGHCQNILNPTLSRASAPESSITPLVSEATARRGPRTSRWRPGTMPRRTTSARRTAVPTDAGNTRPAR